MLNHAKDHFSVAEILRVGGPCTKSFQIHYAPQIDSTMNLLPWCNRKGIEVVDKLCVIAGVQTHGVGQHGSWISSDGDVKLSIVLDDVNSRQAHAMINCAAALSVQRTLTEVCRDHTTSLAGIPAFRVKLANDVLCRTGESFKKISGSLAIGVQDPEIKNLLETRDRFVFPEGKIVLGIGINLSRRDRPVSDPRFEPVGLEDLTGELVSREVVIGVLLRNLSVMISMIKTSPQMLLSALRDELATSSGAVLVVCKSGEECGGIVGGLTPSGLVLLDRVNKSPRRTIPLEDIQRVVPHQE